MAKASTRTATKPTTMAAKAATAAKVVEKPKTAAKAADPKPGTEPARVGAAKAQAAEKAAGELVVQRLNANALSVDVGPGVLKTLFSAAQIIEEANSAILGAKTKQYATLSLTTEAIVKAAKADPAINLNDAFGDNKAKKKHLTEQLLIALGVKEVFITEGGKAAAVYTKAAKPYFPSGTDAKDGPEYKRKRTLLQNFSHLMTKCTEAAAGLMDFKADVSYDEKKGTLLISGPSVEKHFGTEKGSKVALDEKQTEGMTKKPSFTELARVAQVQRGVEKQARGRVNTGPATQGQGVNEPDLAIVSVFQTAAKMLEAFKGDITDAMQGAFDDLNTAWDAIQ